MKWKRKASDSVIQGTGTITKVKCARSFTEEGSSSIDSYRYEIASLEEPEPGIWTRKYEFCNEELIRSLGSCEKLEHEETVEGFQQRDSQCFQPLKEDTEMLGLKPVEKPITSTIKISVPKIDRNLFKNRHDWSSSTSLKTNSPFEDEKRKEAIRKGK